MLDGLGDSENPEEPIYGGLSYGFLSNELIDAYNEAQKITNKDEKSKKVTEIFSQAKGLCSFVVFRKDKLPAENKINTLTKFKNNERLGKKGNYVFYFSYDDYNDLGLSEEAKKMYKALYDDIQNVKKSTKISKPITPQEAIKKLGKIEFKLKDLDGKEYASSDIFKDNKITMINIWATFCGPCKREIPDIQKLYDELKSKNINIIGVIGDTPDADNEAAAVKIVETMHVKYLNLIPDDKFKKNVIGVIAGYPTTIFVDSEGKIVGKVITGSASKEDYQKNIEETLKSLK